GGRVAAWEWTPEDFGLARCSAEELWADGPQRSAAVVVSVLAGDEGPAARVVVANAAAALLAAQRVTTLAEGVARAREAIAAGAARRVLERLRACTAERTDLE